MPLLPSMDRGSHGGPESGSSGSDSSESEKEWREGGEEEEEEDEEQVSISCLLDDSVFSDAASMLAHCKEKHGFDFLAVRDRLGLDFYGTIKLVNFSESLRVDDMFAHALAHPVLFAQSVGVCLKAAPSLPTSPSRIWPTTASSSP